MARAFKHEHIRRKPRGYGVGTVTHPSGHQIRIAFPPGPRRKGAGELLEILHPRGESNPCEVNRSTARGLALTQVQKNPNELVILGAAANPSHSHRLSKKRKRRAQSGSAHAVAEKHGRRVRKMVARMPKPVRDVFDRNPRRKKRARKNQDETDKAVRLFERFHGKSAKSIIELQDKVERRKDYTALGDLVALGLDAQGLSPDELVTKWDRVPHFRMDEKTKLASSPDGTQLYLIGGNQDLSHCLSKFDVDTSKDFIDLGEIPFVVYSARKGPSFADAEWVHSFGEEGGESPSAMYDKLSKKLYFIGGTYRVEQPGIVN